MEKKYEQWSPIKQIVNNERPRVFFEEREIWFSYFGENIGFEQDGKGKEFQRPVLILKKFNKEISWVIPLTHSSKKGLYYFSFQLNGTTSTAILSQIRLLDAKRFKYKIGTVHKNDFAELKSKVSQILG